MRIYKIYNGPTDFANDESTEQEKKEFGESLAMHLCELIYKRFDDVDLNFVKDIHPKQDFDLEEVDLFVKEIAWQQAYDLTVKEIESIV